MANLVMVSYYDCANSGSRYCEAIRRHSFHSVFLARYGKRKDIVDKAIQEADILWFKGDNLPVIQDGKIWLYDDFGKDIVSEFGGWNYKPDVKFMLTAGGSFFRRPLNIDKRIGYGLVPLQKYKDFFHFRTALSPDLNYPELEGEYLPHAFDMLTAPYSWQMSNPIKISYYKAQSDKKNVNRYLLPAVDILNGEGYSVKLLPISGVPYKESIRIKKQSTICYENVSQIGVYGNSGVEALAHGIPLMCNITDTAIQQANPYSDIYGFPILKVASIEDIVATVKGIYNKDIDIEGVSKQSREYALMLHDYPNVSKHIEKIINTIL